jgi:hypothetical protein
VRAADGTITTIDAPGAGTTPGQGTYAGNINPSGVMAASFADSDNLSHGFLRAPDGAITTFDVPSAGTAPGQGTNPFCNNAAGAITGWYVDASNVLHGFLRTAHNEK